MTINVNGELMSFEQPKVMGILNVTPDSFFDGGSYCTADKIKQRLDQIITEGADIVDIGAYSSRPGADDVSADEEWRRLEPTFEIIEQHYKGIITSVDTFRASVARKSVEIGHAAIINDISAGQLDQGMFPTVAELKVPYVLMHMQGDPAHMQDAPSYKDVVSEVIIFLSRKVEELHKMGVCDIIIDPGFGFGKTIEHNYTLFHHLHEFKMFGGMPILVGISRKSMIYKLLESSPKEALNGTSVLNTLAIMNGANILRVHDVREAVECVKIVKYYCEMK